MIVFWIAATVAFAALEAATVGLVSIWFVAGSLAALAGAALGAPIWAQVLLFAAVSGVCFAILVAAALNASFWIQLIVFIAVSAVVLAFLRPIARKYLKVRARPTNADKVLGTLCPVTEAIDNIAGTGAVTAGGKEWTARSASGAPIPAGERVRAVAIRGVTLIVERVREEVKS